MAKEHSLWLSRVQRVVTKCVIMNCKYINCCRSEHLFPSAVSVASNDLVFTDENYNYTLVMGARDGVMDGVFIPGRRNCTYPVLEEDLWGSPDPGD